MIDLRTGVEYTQAYGCWLCLHIWTVAVYFGSRNRGVRI